ncbi:MAG: uncharacterized protein KVP18_002844 [Porospora cf. gigantea A]|uniref:uncharacterized protein n=1 Tax=Porospora cf. gigantea A TaxID=2853593 RepID=UPI00355AB661|nr:MAG: hypothetical protein KVP18_002844 [Porospora cf. gigantea A]
MRSPTSVTTPEALVPPKVPSASSAHSDSSVFEQARRVRATRQRKRFAQEEDRAAFDALYNAPKKRKVPAWDLLLARLVELAEKRREPRLSISRIVDGDSLSDQSI